MITIRNATPKDLEIILSFNKKLSENENQEFDSTLNPDFSNTEGGQEYFRKIIENRDKLALIAEVNNMPVGYLAGGLEEVGDYRNIPNMCEIDNMWVDEEFRSTGIGKQLLKKAERWAEDRGIKRMRVIASHLNTRGVTFYKREGFEEYDLILEKDL